MAARPFFPGIQALRAIAATLVVIEHAGSIHQSYTVFGYSYLIPYFSFGRIGVILFFAISGFVIALQRDKPIRAFVIHRLLRIYPAYWLATALATVVLGNVTVTAESLLLYPSSTYDTSSGIPYWTLVFEMTFYTLATVAFGLRLSDRALTIAALAWLLAVNLFGHNPTSEAEFYFPGRWILLSPEVQVFPMGLLCGIHFERMKMVSRAFYFAASLPAFAAVALLPPDTVSQMAAMGVFASCIVMALADLSMPYPVRRLGDASYGIYLMHSPAMHAVSQLSDGWLMMAGIAAGTLFGLLDHRLYRWLTAPRR